MQSVVKATFIIFGVMIALADSRADSIKIDDGQFMLMPMISTNMITYQI